MLIAIDHGNYAIKTPHTAFLSGLSEHKVKPPLAEEVVEYGGSYWTLSGKRLPYMRDKTRDSRFFVLTLFAIGRELERRGYEVTVGRTGDKEINFVCDKRGEKLYVQVCYLLASEETVSREFVAYDSIRDNFPKYVVSLDEFDMSRNGIKHRNIRDFLLAEEWN